MKKGSKMTQEQKDRISKAKMGHGTSKETKKKISKALKGNKNGLGVEWSEDQKLAHSKKMGEVNNRPEVREARRAARTGATVDDRTKSKLSSALKGKPKSKAAKENMSKAWTSERRREQSKRFRDCIAPSKPQMELYEKLKTRYPEAELEYPLEHTNGTLYLDIALPSIKVDIEYDGEFWHERKNKSAYMTDDRRDKILVELGWAVIRISSNDEDETVEAKLSEIEIAYT